MRIIPTTKTAVEKLRARAREIQRIESIPYGNARERAAQEAGYDDWRHVLQSLHPPGEAPQPVEDQETPATNRESSNDERRQFYMQFLKTHGTATVTPVPPPSRGDVFHSVLIEGNRFDGFIAEGNLYLLRKRLSSDPVFVSDSSVNLGVAVIRKTGHRFGGDGPKQWHVCKYGAREPCVFLGGLSKAGRLTLAAEFGIPSFEDLCESIPWTLDMEWLRAPIIQERLFFLSPAFQALVQWCLAHPRKARSMECLPYYLGDWKSAALDGRWPAASDNYVSDEGLTKALRGSSRRPGGTPTQG